MRSLEHFISIFCFYFLKAKQLYISFERFEFFSFIKKGICIEKERKSKKKMAFTKKIERYVNLVESYFAVHLRNARELPL